MIIVVMVHVGPSEVHLESLVRDEKRGYGNWAVQLIGVKREL